MTRDEFLLVDDREVVITPAVHVRCDGTPGAEVAGTAAGNNDQFVVPGGNLGHPTEFITLEKGGEAICKYCGRRFVHTSAAAAAELRRRGTAYRL